MTTLTPTHHGVDVSSNNTHPIDYATAVRYLRILGNGTQPFAIIKATQGTSYINPFFAQDVAGFRAAGAAVGAYLMDQGNADPSAEERFFSGVVGGLPQFDDDELPSGLSNDAYAQHCASLLAQFPPASVYLNGSEEASGFPEGSFLWEANPNGNPGEVINPNALLHQFSWNASIPGIAGQTDLSAWLGDEMRFAQLFHLAAPVAQSTSQTTISPPEGKLIIVSHPTKPDSYWLIKPDGSVDARGDANYFGGANKGAPHAPASIDSPIDGADHSLSGNGYYLVSQKGSVYTFGDATWKGNAA